jgi:hypothetical protein
MRTTDKLKLFFMRKTRIRRARHVSKWRSSMMSRRTPRLVCQYSLHLRTTPKMVRIYFLFIYFSLRKGLQLLDLPTQFIDFIHKLIGFIFTEKQKSKRLMAKDVINTIQTNEEKRDGNNRGSSNRSSKKGTATNSNSSNSSRTSEDLSSAESERKPVPVTPKQSMAEKDNRDVSIRSESKSSRKSLDHKVNEPIEWIVKVYTSDIRDKTRESTDSNVYISFIDDSDETETIWLSRENLRYQTRDLFRALFEQGHMDEFVITPKKWLRDIKKIRIGHDNSGLSPGWHLQKVEVAMRKDPAVKFTFLCNRWLASNQDDKKIERILNVYSSKEATTGGESSHRSNSRKSTGSLKKNKDNTSQAFTSDDDSTSNFSLPRADSKTSMVSNKSQQRQESRNSKTDAKAESSRTEKSK